MAETRGGYRKPANPAPTSGPGSLSQRTDGGPAQGAKYISGLPYGEGRATYDQQTAAPMAAAAPTPPTPEVPSGPPMLSLNDPTQRPDEPLTAGLNIGEGPGAEVMRNVPNRSQSLVDTIRYLAQFDPSGDAELIYRKLTDQGY
jgi:hypothetical protein